MVAEVASNSNIQFQNDCNSLNFDDQTQQDFITSDVLDFTSLEELLEVKPDLLTSLPFANNHTNNDDDLEKFLQDNVDANTGEIDDMFDLGMFDFGVPDANGAYNANGAYEQDPMNETAETVPTSEEEEQQALRIPSLNQMDPFCTPPLDSIPSLDNNNQNGFQANGFCKNDSDGFTDFEEQFNEIPQLGDQNYNFHAPAVPLDQNPFYTDIQFNWPPLNEMLCGNCQAYRQIIHSNGIQDTKLEIHGRNGQFYHAVMHTRCSITGIARNMEQQTVEFAMATTEYVKQFLFQYNLLRRREGFIIRYDSLPAYPDAMNLDSMDGFCNPNSVGGFYNQSYQPPYLNPYDMASGFRSSNSGFFPSQPFQGQYWMGNGYYGPAYGMNQRAMPNNNPSGKPHKSNVAAQRERTGKLKISDLAAYFHLPINVAAKELAICPTVLKKICRRNGMRRWPHRKIKSIERIIMTLEQTIAEGNGEGVESIKAEIEMLKNVRAQLCSGVAVDEKH